MTTEYHKIPSPFTRNEQTRAWNIGDWSTPELAILKDAEWLWTEKLDGTNIRIEVERGEVRVKGRSDNAQLPPTLLNWINAKVSEGHFTDAVKGDEVVTIYGEGIGPKIQKGGDLYGDVRVVVFDVRAGRTWLKRQSVEGLAASLGLEVAPVVGRGTIYEAITRVHDGLQSAVARFPKEAEGLVLRLDPDLLTRFGERIITKVKAEDVRRIKDFA